MGVARGRCRAAGVVAGVLACVLAVAPSASADVPSVPASGGASQCVPDRSTIAQCFPDKALAQAIAKELKGDSGKTGDVLTSQDVENTTSINLSTTDHSEFSGISSVQGLQVFTKLDYLYLQGTRVSDVSPLAKLPYLFELDLSGTQVSDVSPLAKLTNLVYLDLSGTQVSDATLSSVAKLTNLNYLFLSKTRVLDVSPLAKLTKLSYLVLSGVSPSVNLTVNADGSVSLPAPRWTDGTFVAPRSTSPAGGVLDAKRGVVTWKKYDANASYSYDFAGGIADYGDPFTGHVAGVKPQARVVFRDVSSSTPHASDIAWLADAGVSTGWREPDGSYSFRGMDSVKRQDMAAFLRREAKRLGVKDAASWKPSDEDWKQFRDVSPSAPHAEDVLWLAHANVSTGWLEPDGSRTFRGMDPVRRQDMAAFLRREARLMGVEDASSWRPSDADWRRFRDVSRDTPHAEDILWLAHAGVSKGYADGTFGGMLPVYRQDMAAFLHRLDNLKK